MQSSMRVVESTGGGLMSFIINFSCFFTGNILHFSQATRQNLTIILLWVCNNRRNLFKLATASTKTMNETKIYVLYTFQFSLNFFLCMKNMENIQIYATAWNNSSTDRSEFLIKMNSRRRLRTVFGCCLMSLSFFWCHLSCFFGQQTLKHKQARQESCLSRQQYHKNWS